MYDYEANFNKRRNKRLQGNRAPLPQGIVIASSQSGCAEQLGVVQTFQPTLDDNDDLLDLLIRPPLTASILYPLLGRRHAAVRHSQNRDSKEVDDDDRRDWRTD